MCTMDLTPKTKFLLSASRRLFLVCSFSLSLLFFCIACSKKEETNSDVSHEKGMAVDVKEITDPYVLGVQDLSSTIARFLPEGTYGFVLFLNKDNLATRQKEYWQKDLPENVKEIIDQSTAGLEKMLDQVGLLEGRTTEEVYEMESAQFLVHLDDKSSEEESEEELVEASEASSGFSKVDQSGFITKLKINDLQLKVKEISDALTKSGSPSKVIKEGDTAIIEFSESYFFLSGFKYLALKDSLIVFGSSVSLIDEIFESENKPLPPIFLDSEFKKLAEKLPNLSSSVIFAGYKGTLSSLKESMAGMPIPLPGDAPGNKKTDTNDSLDESKPFLIAFNQSFDNFYKLQLRVKSSEDIFGFTPSTIEGNQKSFALAKSKLPANTIFDLEFSNALTDALKLHLKNQLGDSEQKIKDFAELLNTIGLSLSTTEGQKSFLPLPSILLRLDVSDHDKALPLFESLLHDQLLLSGMIPPNAPLVKEGEDLKSILTAFGEEIIISRSNSSILVGTSRDQIKTSITSNATANDQSLLDITPYLPDSEISKGSVGTFIWSLFLNFKTLNSALEKVFTMSAVFGQEARTKSAGVQIADLGKALSALGAMGAKAYVEDDVYVLTLHTKKMPEVEKVDK